MKIRVASGNKQEDEICFDDITDIFIVPYGDIDDERTRFQIWVDTFDRKNLYVEENELNLMRKATSSLVEVE